MPAASGGKNGSASSICTRVTPPSFAPTWVALQLLALVTLVLKAVVEWLEERGIAYERALQGAGTVQIWFTDPAGNTIEIQQETADC